MAKKLKPMSEGAFATLCVVVALTLIIAGTVFMAWILGSPWVDIILWLKIMTVILSGMAIIVFGAWKLEVFSLKKNK